MLVLWVVIRLGFADESSEDARQNKPDFVGQSNIDLEWKVKENRLLKSKIRTFLSANA